MALNHLLHGLKVSAMEEDMEAKLFAIFSLISIPYREEKIFVPLYNVTNIS